MFHKKEKETEVTEVSANKVSAKNIYFSVKKKILGKNWKNSDTAQDIKKAFKHINPKKAITAFVVGIFAIYLLTGIYIVNPGEQAVVKRFGKLLPETIQEGIHYRLPTPIDEVQIVNVEEVRRADVGMSLPEHMLIRRKFNC